MHTTKYLKSQAKLLRAHFSSQGIEITHSQALEAIAAAHAFRNWRTAEAMLSAETSDADEATGQRDALKSSALGEAIQANVQTVIQIAPARGESAENLTPGKRIELARYSLHRTQSELCSLCPEIGLVRLKRLETEFSDPTAKELKSLMKAGINPMWVIAGIPPMLTGAITPLAAKDLEQGLQQSIDDLLSSRTKTLEAIEKNPQLYPADSASVQKLKDSLVSMANSVDQIKQALT